MNINNKCLLFCCLVADYAKRRYMSLPEKGYNPRHSEEFYRKHLYSLLLQVLFVSRKINSDRVKVFLEKVKENDNKKYD